MYVRFVCEVLSPTVTSVYRVGAVSAAKSIIRGSIPDNNGPKINPPLDSVHLRLPGRRPAPSELNSLYPTPRLRSGGLDQGRDFGSSRKD